MGKLNYTNRKVEGVKLGQIVAKDLMKRVTPGPISKAALRDPYVELDISGRRLTDEGFAEIAGVLSSPQTRDEEHGRVVRLEELCLAGNALTASCLLALARVIQDAAAELRDLDLSENIISVSSVEDGLAWEEFLRSFRTCSVLRRLNFSGNALGSWAFEILARVYGDETPLDLLPVEDEHFEASREGLVPADVGRIYNGVSVLNKRMGNTTLGCETHDDTEHSLEDVREGSRRRDARKNSSAGNTVLAYPAAAAVESRPIYVTTRGLRSIPYILFIDTSMTEAGALHLSYVLENHNLPKDLLPYVPAKAGLAAHEPEARDDSPSCQGIEYLPNAKLSSAGMKVLEVAEFVRKGVDSEASQEDPSPLKSAYTTAIYPRRMSDAGSCLSSAQPRGRRHSTMTSSTGTHPTHAGTTWSVTNELDRARSRIQGSILKDFGPNSVELWRASLKMLNIARQVLVEEPKEQSDGGDGSLGKGPLDETKSKPTYAAKLMNGAPVTDEPVVPVIALSNVPATFTIARKRKGSNVPTRQIPPLTSSLPPSPSPMVSNTPEMVPAPSVLPEPVWRRIISLAAGAVGVVSTRQQDSILQWAKNRDTLGKGKEALGKAESEQIWRVLEGMGCLSYDVRA